MELRQKKKKKTLINITSLIDVLFILLIFFMVSSSFRNKSEIELDLPVAGESASDEAEKGLEIFVNSEGSVVWDEKILTIEELTTKLKEVSAETPEKVVNLNADKDVSHGKIVEVMETIQKSGLTKLSVVTQIHQ